MRIGLAFLLATSMVAAIACPAPLTAQDAARSVKEMLDCRDVADGAGRLRCYDRTAGVVAAARNSGELVTLDRSKVVTAKKRGFGLPTPRVAARAVSDPLADVRQIDGVVAQTRPAEYGRWLIALDKNGVWKNIDPINGPPRTGAAIRIVRAGFGGFRATVGKDRPFLIKRVQ